MLKQMVTAGLRGRKTGRGFYTYDAPGLTGRGRRTRTRRPDRRGPRGRRRGRSQDVRRVGVVGSGTMATGIVEVFAKAGYDTLYVARGEEKVARVRAALERSLDKAVLRGKLDAAERDAALARVSGTVAHRRPGRPCTSSSRR